MRRILFGMSGYTPKAAIKVAKPCSESWEAMPGDARVRHCGGCDRDVHNLAAMTPAQIDALLAKPGPLPCMRIVRNVDGSLMTARVEQKPGVIRRASRILSTVMLMAGSASAQTGNTSKPKPIASLEGQVVDATQARRLRTQKWNSARTTNRLSPQIRMRRGHSSCRRNPEHIPSMWCGALASTEAMPFLFSCAKGFSRW